MNDKTNFMNLFSDQIWGMPVYMLLAMNVLVIAGVVVFFACRKKPVAVELPVEGDGFLANCRKFNLTARETQVVLLIRKGYKNKRIAEELFISEKTVDVHLQNVYDKVGERGKLALIQKLNE